MYVCLCVFSCCVNLNWLTDVVFTACFHRLLCLSCFSWASLDGFIIVDDGKHLIGSPVIGAEAGSIRWMISTVGTRVYARFCVVSFLIWLIDVVNLICICCLP